MNTKTRDLIFVHLLKNAGLPKPEAEYKFYPSRRWRFDFAFIDRKLAIEIEGGIWQHGRHNRPGGFINDCEKYNTAAMEGWQVLRIPAGDIHKVNTISMISNVYSRLLVDKLLETELF